MGTMTADFAGDVALVTGSAGGMGRAIALAFAAAGATVVMGDVDDAGGRETERLARGGGRIGRCSCRPTSPTPDAVAALVATAVDRFGGLRCAVNAAAIENETAPLHECDHDTFDRMQSVNVRGVFLCMKYEIAAMLANEPGERRRSRGDRQHRLDELVPAAARSAGVHGVEARRARADPQRGDRLRGTRHPHQCDLSRHDRHADAAQRDGAAWPRPRRTSSTVSACVGRFGTPEEIAAAALWLCSDAASFTLGHALAVDAGYARSMIAADAPIRAVVWDFGGVLITPITTLIDEIAGWHGITMVEMLDVLMGPARRRRPITRGTAPSVVSWRRRRCRPRSRRSPRRPG